MAVNHTDSTSAESHYTEGSIHFTTTWEPIFNIGSFEVTTTLLSTWIFMWILFIIVVFFNLAIKTNKFLRLKTFWLDVVARLDWFFTDIVGSENKKEMRKYFPVLAWFFVFILLWNIFWLILDWFGLFVPYLHGIFRPFNSDIYTTLPLAIVAIFMTHIAGMINKWLISHWSHYFFNFSWESIVEKIINVPVGWIHFIWEFSKILSLSVRLFANIFAWVILILAMNYLWAMIGSLWGVILLPFWFYELLVAFIQAFVFVLLTSIYLKDSITHHH